MLTASEGRAQPAHAVSELRLSFATTSVNEFAVASDTIMCGDDVPGRTWKVQARSTLDQLKRHCFPQMLRTKSQQMRS